MKLPNAENAIVDEVKVRDYLRSPERAVGRFKARVVRAAGYEREGWPRLRDDLLALARTIDGDALGRRPVWPPLYWCWSTSGAGRPALASDLGLARTFGRRFATPYGGTQALAQLMRADIRPVANSDVPAVLTASRRGAA